MKNLSDAELIERAVVGGDSEAFRALLDRHYTTIFKFAYHWCGHRQDAEDVAQEVCMKLANVLHSYKGESSFTSWLYPIVMNKARDLFRSRTAERKREAGYVETDALLRESDPSQEDAAIRNEALSAITALPDDLKATVLLVAGEGLSHREAGKILECAEGTVSWRMNKAKELLAHLSVPGGQRHG